MEILKSNFKLVDGIPGWPQNMIVVRAVLEYDRINFYKAAAKNSEPVSLMYNQIVETRVFTEKEIIEKSKSVGGRAAAGALLFGPVGAIIGGMSGIGNKHRTSVKLFYTISFIASSGDPGMITLDASVIGCHLQKFDAELKKHFTPPAAPSVL